MELQGKNRGAAGDVHPSFILPASLDRHGYSRSFHARPDLSKCDNPTCPLRGKCWRWTTYDARGWQECNRREPNQDGTCAGFLPTWFGKI